MLFHHRRPGLAKINPNLLDKIQDIFPIDDVVVMILYKMSCTDHIRISFFRLEMRRMTCLQDILALPDGRQLAAQWQVGFKIIQ
jgi:hypothetical protein